MSGEESEATVSFGPLAAEALCWRCPSDHFTFETTEDLEALTEVIGQDRAVEAIRFAIGMRQQGYNLYALGPEGMGKHTAVRRFLEEQAKQEMAPPVSSSICATRCATASRATSTGPGAR
jgi:hypothetical protein